MSGAITAVVATVTAVASEIAGAVSLAAEMIGGAVMDGLGAMGVGESASISIGSAVSSGVEGAIYGAGIGAVSTPITGGDLGQNMLFGALGGGFGGAVTPAISGAISPTVGSTAGKYIGRGLGNAFGGTVASGVMGKDPLLPALGGLASGAIDYAVGELPSTGSKTLNSALQFGEKQALNTAAMTGLADLFASSPTQSSQTYGGQYYPTSSGQSSTSASTTGQGVSPGSSALAQVLRTDAGAPVFGSSDKEGDKGKSGWNIESLRYMGSEA